MDPSLELSLRQIFTAIKNKNTNKIHTLLIQLGGYVNSKSPDADGRAPLHEVAKIGDENILKLFVEYARINFNVNINIKDNLGSTPLHYVIERENFKAAQILIEVGADMLASNKNGKTPLHILIERQVNSKIIKSLINMKNIRGKFMKKNSLSEAVRAGNVEIIQLLIDYSFDMNEISTKLLHEAAESNIGESHFEVAKLLLKTGLDVNDQDHLNNTALHYLVNKACNIKMIELFIELKVNVDIKNVNGEIALFNAISVEGNLEVVRKLIDHGSDVNSVSNDGSTVLHKAVSCNSGESQFQIVELLLNAGADVHIKDKNGETPLFSAIVGHFPQSSFPKPIFPNFGENGFGENGFWRKRVWGNWIGESVPLPFSAVTYRNDKIVQLLLDHGSDINTVDQKGSTVLLQVTGSTRRDDNLSTVGVLLRNRANVNSRDEYGETPLHHLVSYRNNAKTITLLLDYKPDVKTKDNHDKIPLFYAIINNYDVDVLQLLLDHGSDVNCVIGSDKWRPLHFAAVRYENSCKVVKCFLKNGADANALDSTGRTLLLILLQQSSSLGRNFDKTLQFLFKYSNINEIDQTEKELLSSIKIEEKWKMVLKHVAKLQALELHTNPAFEKSISNRLEYSDYFLKCLEELNVAKNTKLKNCWVTFFNLLTDSRRQLKNYAGNFDLIEDFEKSDCIKKFPIYGSEMQENLEKGKKRRKLSDKSSGMLSNNLPIFGPLHLVIRDVLDILATKELSKFCNEN